MNRNLLIGRLTAVAPQRVSGMAFEEGIQETRMMCPAALSISRQQKYRVSH